jgi:hypothetical protein
MTVENKRGRPGVLSNRDALVKVLETFAKNPQDVSRYLKNKLANAGYLEETLVNNGANPRKEHSLTEKAREVIVPEGENNV